MNEYLDQLTYDQLDALYFAVWNTNPASDFLGDISAAINRLQFPILEGVVVDVEPVEYVVLQLAAMAG